MHENAPPILPGGEGPDGPKGKGEEAGRTGGPGPTRGKEEEGRTGDNKLETPRVNVGATT